MKKIHVLMMASFAFLYSCSKSDSGNGNTEEPSVKLHKEITAKWKLDAEMVNSLLPRNQVPVPQGRPLDTEERDPSLDQAYVEFLSDSTYIVSYNTMIVLTGKFSAKSGDSIVLENGGSLGGIKLASDKLEGRFHYDLISQTINISAPKVAPIASDERTKLLSRHWNLAKEENYGAWFDSQEEPADSLNLYFTNAGSIYVRAYYEGQPAYSEVLQWNWHATTSNKIIFWDYEGVEYASEWTIRENTSSVLKVTEWFDFEGTPDDDEVKFTFRPVK